MKICYLAPSIHKPHGGIRVLFEHCNHLALMGHEVTLDVFGDSIKTRWAHISPDVSLRIGRQITDEFDVIVASTPPLALMLASAKVKAKKFYFLQMAEHLFSHKAVDFNRQALTSYRVPFPIIGISRWVEYLVRTEGKRGDLPMHYVGNGVSSDFLPAEKDEKLTVLVEGWESYGDSKDVSGIAPKVAARLKKEFGATVLAYSQFPLSRFTDVPDEYYQVPTQKELVRLYQRSHILLKASLLDARSCAPVEAIACGCVPVRAIRRGDDDLINKYNCLRSEYDEEAMYANAVRLIEDEILYRALAENGQKYRKDFLSWPMWIEIIEDIYINGQ